MLKDLAAAIMGCCLLFFFPPLVHAQSSGIEGDETASSSPKLRIPTVTAQVPAFIAPPPPILIAPSNGAILTSGVVTFEWEDASDHPVAISRYELHLNGEIKFEFIHPTDQETDDYILTYEDGKYRLQLKPDKWLPDGNYTWKVRVIDANDRGTDSTTWSFTIDSTPPPLLIVKVDKHVTSISAQDPQTIPVDAFVVRRKPTIVGKTEASSEVQLIVTYSGGITKQYKTTATLAGDFSFALEALPANQIVSLKFIAIDLAKNSRVLDRLLLLYSPRVLVIELPFLPGDVTIEIPLEIPISIGPFRPFPFLPPELGGPTREEPVEVLTVPIFDSLPWLLIWISGLLLYLLSVFSLTGNAWLFFPRFAMNLGWWWLFWWGFRPHDVWERARREPLPFVAFDLIWLDAKQRIHRRARLSGPDGTWSLPHIVDKLMSIEVRNTMVEYPIRDLVISETRAVQDTRWLHLDGEGILQYQEGASSRKTTSKAFAVLVEKGSKHTYHFRLWLRALRSPRARVAYWLPRMFLVIAGLAAVWLLYHRPFWWHALPLAVVLLVALRDGQWNLPRRLKAYESK